MGEVVSASLVRDDGVTEAALSWPRALPSSGLLELAYDYRPALLPAPGVPHAMWRYVDLLPIERGPVRYPLAVGGTPLVALDGLRRLTGLPRLFLKDETRGPTGSNKDRATALVLEHALRTGASTVSCASTGNVAVSLAVGAAAAGVRAVVFVPADVNPAKLTLMHLAGASVLRVQGSYETAFRLAREAAAHFGWLDRNTGVNPWTIEAKKTVALEIWEQLGRRMPDVVLAPVGDGPTLCALAKGFRELVRCGGADRLPRLIGVQAEGCQPVKRAFDLGTTVEPTQPATIADGMEVASPIGGAMAVRDVRESGGAFVAVSDAEMLSAIRTLARTAGLIAEPAGASAFAGLLTARSAGLVGGNDTAVVLVTGSGLKTPQFLQPDGAVADVQPNLEAVAKAADALG